MSNNLILVYLSVVLNLICFILGFLLGKITAGSGVSLVDKPVSFIKVQKNKPDISIDSTKFVNTIKTENLEKKYDSLGEISTSESNIQSSINKLKNMKG